MQQQDQRNTQPNYTLTRVPKSTRGRKKASLRCFRTVTSTVSCSTRQSTSMSSSSPPQKAPSTHTGTAKVNTEGLVRDSCIRPPAWQGGLFVKISAEISLSESPSENRPNRTGYDNTCTARERMDFSNLTIDPIGQAMTAHAQQEKGWISWCMIPTNVHLHGQKKVWSDCQ